MTSAGNLWDDMTEAQRQPIVDECEKLQEEGAAIAARETSRLDVGPLPHGLGCRQWPVARDQVSHLCHGAPMKSHADEWHNRYGNRIQLDPAVVQMDTSTAPEHRTCGQLFGAQVCREDFTPEDRKRHAALKNDLSAIQRAWKDSAKKLVLHIACHLDVEVRVRFPSITMVSLTALYNSPPKQIFNMLGVRGRW